MLSRLWHERMAGLHNTWEARLLYGDELRLPLEDMVVPLRLRPLRGGTPQELPLDALSSPLVVVGSAGSGKTTWLRHLFRRLLAAGELPLLLELRDLRQAWEGSSGSARSLDRWLDESLKELVPDAPADWFQQLMEDEDAPPLTLLLDGWDELGALAQEARGKLLGLWTQRRRLRLVLTSRSVGHWLPRHRDGFSEYLLEPLDDRQIETLARRVFEQDDDDADAFIAALERDDEARELARRPLLLQMMLMLDPEERLPNRLHRLCRSCVEHLLLSRGEDLDATMELDEEEQVQVLSQLAAELLGGDAPRPRDLAKALPAGWSPRRRKAWIDWLTRSSGLAEVVDDHVRFVHQSVVDALAAEHLHRTIRDPDDRRLRFHELAGQAGHGGVLRLWAALVEEEHPGASGALAQTLSTTGDAGLALAGALYAEGYGSPIQFTEWTGAFRAALVDRWPVGASGCARTWARSGDPVRRREFAELLAAGSAGLQWPGWLRVREFGLQSWLVDELERPVVPSLSAYVVDAIDGLTLNERVVAASRFLSEGSPLWPGHPWELALLWLWPGRRPALGRWLQRLASLGMSRGELRACAAAWAPAPLDAAWKHSVVAEWTGDLLDDGTVSSAERWAMRLALQEPRPGGIEVWAGQLVSEMNVVMDEREELRRKPAAAILQAALRYRTGRLSGEDFAQECAASADQQPFWLALARTVAELPRPGDREVLLAELDAVPDHDPGLQAEVGRELEWGLRWIVRGDVLMADGSVCTLDELGVDLPVLD